jgi:hypothetical protein
MHITRNAVSSQWPLFVARRPADSRHIDHSRDESFAKEANELGRFHDIIHHHPGSSYNPSGSRIISGLPFVFPVNSRAPSILTCQIKKPKRLVYVC